MTTLHILSIPLTFTSKLWKDTISSHNLYIYKLEITQSITIKVSETKIVITKKIKIKKAKKVNIDTMISSRLLFFLLLFLKWKWYLGLHKRLYLLIFTVVFGKRK